MTAPWRELFQALAAAQAAGVGPRLHGRDPDTVAWLARTPLRLFECHGGAADGDQVYAALCRVGRATVTTAGGTDGWRLDPFARPAAIGGLALTGVPPAADLPALAARLADPPVLRRAALAPAGGPAVPLVIELGLAGAPGRVWQVSTKAGDSRLSLAVREWPVWVSVSPRGGGDWWFDAVRPLRPTDGIPFPEAFA